MAVTEVVGLKSVFEDPPHFQLFKHHSEIVEDILRLTTLLVSMVGFTEYITSNEKVICAPKQTIVQSQNSKLYEERFPTENRQWLKITSELCEDELTSLAER